MLLRFIKHTPGEWGMDFHTWYNAGDCAVGTVLKQDAEGIYLLMHSDDDAIVIVEPGSFEVIEHVECWDQNIPQICSKCNEELDPDVFFHAHGDAMCIKCFNESDYYLTKPLLSQYGCVMSRFELDKSTARWVRTG